LINDHLMKSECVNVS